MEFDINPKSLEMVNAVWETPYGIAAALLFYSGLAVLLILMVKRHNMSIVQALLALVGLKKVPERDMIFNLFFGVIVVGCLGMLVISLQIVADVAN
ncbi:hypothetical protein [uncultured Pseudoteredinibacter sp.]|uniref:hypothetical protein n=1 Tax=uncultured Pseudoteredinibacter sp. TaxID=1641701 RepID=UPI00260645F4|nr:hypothetical protein [uncultured Pseudoteredinibacter sp.]